MLSMFRSLKVKSVAHALFLLMAFCIFLGGCGEGKISPLADLSNVVLTPHIGASTIDSQREIGQRVIEIVNSFIAGRAETEAAS